jgi:hypothetical protein
VVAQPEIKRAEMMSKSNFFMSGPYLSINRTLEKSL